MDLNDESTEINNLKIPISAYDSSSGDWMVAGVLFGTREESPNSIGQSAG